MFRRLAVVAAAGMALATVAAPASASTGAAAAGPVRSDGPAITCSVFAGHYCAKVFFTSVNGGVRVNQTKSTGYTTGAGKGREYFRYSCNAGTCYILPSATFRYSRANTQLNVTRTFSGSGFFLPCGAKLGVDYINPAVNAPGPGAVTFNVTCSSADGRGHL